VELIGTYLVACVLLVTAGAAKALRPGDTARALAAMLEARSIRGARPGVLRTAVRLGALAEAVLGIVAIALPRPLTATLVGASYVAFAGVVTYARATGSPLATCGCFATPDSPATLLHVALDVLLGAAALVVASGAPHTGSIRDVLAHQPLGGVALLVVVGVGTWLAYLAFTVMGSLESARRLVGVRHR